MGLTTCLDFLSDHFHAHPSLLKRTIPFLKGALVASYPGGQFACQLREPNHRVEFSNARCQGYRSIAANLLSWFGPFGDVPKGGIA